MASLFLMSCNVIPAMTPFCLQRRSFHSTMSLTTTSTTDVDQLFTPLALYQGKLVAVKRVTKRAAIQLTKPRLIELKQVSGRDVMLISN